MLFQEFLTNNKRDELITQIKTRLTQFKFVNTDLTDVLLRNIFSYILEYYSHRTILPNPAQLSNFLKLELSDVLPEFINSLKKYSFWNDYINSSNFGTTSKQSNVAVDGAIPQQINASNVDNLELLGYSKNVDTSSMTSYELQSSVREIANTYFWKLGFYDKIVKRLEVYFVGVNYYEF